MASTKSSRHNRDTLRAHPFSFTLNFFVLFAGVSAALAIVYVVYPAGLIVPLVVDALLVGVTLLDYFAPPSARDVRITRARPYPLAVGHPNEIVLDVINRSGRTVSLTVWDDIPFQCESDQLPVRTEAPPGSGTRIRYRLTPFERGDGEFGNIHHWLRGALGLVWKRGESPAAQTVKLFPGLALVRERRLGIRHPAADRRIRPIRRRGVGTEFDSLREYTVGDDYRLIHWSTTARLGRPTVRQNRLERSQNIFLVLDAGRMMTARVFGRTKLDHALDAALLTAYSALEMGDKAGVMVTAANVLSFTPPAATAGQFGRILNSVYAVEARLEEPRFHLALATITARVKRRSLIIIFTDLIDERASAGLLRYTLGLLPRHLPLVAAMPDTEVLEIADSIPETPHDLYRKGVASNLLDRRESLIAKLTTAGVHVLDVPPDRISPAVLDRYLEIKTKGLL